MRFMRVTSHGLEKIAGKTERKTSTCHAVGQGNTIVLRRRNSLGGTTPWLKRSLALSRFTAIHTHIWRPTWIRFPLINSWTFELVFKINLYFFHEIHARHFSRVGEDSWKDGKKDIHMPCSGPRKHHSLAAQKQSGRNYTVAEAKFSSVPLHGNPHAHLKTNMNSISTN